MNDILKYIHNNITLSLSAVDVAKKFGYSKWYFCDKFKSFTGKTFVEYVRHYRIQLSAMEILSGRKIQDVAMDYGYDTVSGFNKAFLKEYGCSPTEYKKQAKEAFLYYEKRRISMIQLSDRCAALRDEAVNKKHYQRYYAIQRNLYYELGAADAMEAGLMPTEVISEGITRVIEKFTPVIIPGELLVGFNHGEDNYGEYCLPEDTEEGWALIRDNGISEEDGKRFFEIKRNPPKNPTPDYVVEFTEAEWKANAERAGNGRCIADTHTVIGYEKVLRLGFSGILKEIEAAEKKNGSLPMYNGMKKFTTAALKMGDKFADAAEKIKQSGNEEYNSADLDFIISTCRNVPKNPARNFAEAVQSLLFAHLLNTWEDHINANSLGRLDQILYPYYKADIEKGVLTKEEAFEIICCLWIKLYRDYDVQQSCVGGSSADGSSDVNELSYLMLDVTEQLGFIRCLSVRYSENTEKEFLRRALEVTGHVQKGVPFYFNDDVMIPALVSKGIAFKDACDYTQIGCVETVIPGKSNPHAVTGEMNMLKALEYVFGNGHSMMHPDYFPGIETGSLDNFKTYESFYNAVMTQVKRLLDLTCSQVKKSREYAVIHVPRPYKSLLTEGCLESGRDFNDAGAVYDYYQIMLCGIPNLADSLAVIRKFIYEDKKYTLDELKEILVNNFPDEAVRQEFINKAPKYGNDISEVDDIAAEIMNLSCDILDELSEKYNLSFHAQPFTFLWMIDHGNESIASPDGRRSGEPLAYSCSSMQGRDFNGLTALLNSIAKLPTKRAPGTTSAIVEVDPKLFCDRNIDTLTDIMIAASKKGLCNVQFNIVDAETLIEAKKHPEKYNNLAVRVSGFSQKFNLLSPELQDHIIGRTKHTCL